MSQEKKLLVKTRFCNRKWNYLQDRIFLGTNILVLVSFQREIASVQILHRVYMPIKSNIPLSLLPVIKIFHIPIILHIRFLNLVKFVIDILHNKFLLLSNNNPSLALSLEEIPNMEDRKIPSTTHIRISAQKNSTFAKYRIKYCFLVSAKALAQKYKKFEEFFTCTFGLLLIFEQLCSTIG